MNLYDWANLKKIFHISYESLYAKFQKYNEYPFFIEVKKENTPIYHHREVPVDFVAAYNYSKNSMIYYFKTEDNLILFKLKYL